MLLRPDDFSVRYNLLFPLYAHLPPAYGYRLAAQQADFFRQRKQDEQGMIRTQMQGALPDASPAQLDGWISDYYRMVEQEALDTWYLQHQPAERIVELQGFEVVEQARRQGKRRVADRRAFRALLDGGAGDAG